MSRIEAKGYLSGVLTSLPAIERASVLRFYEEVGALAKGYGIDVYLPHQHSDPFRDTRLSPRQVFEMARARIRDATVMIADLTRPSLGVGGEMIMCWTYGTQIILLCEEDRYRELQEDPVERSIFEIPAIQATILYKDHPDALEQLDKLLSKEADRFKQKIQLPPPPWI